MMDFHCHLDLIPDAMSILPIVATNNSFTLSVTTSPKGWAVAAKILSSYPNIAVGLGLHPEIVEQKKAEFEYLISEIPSTAFIGEVGLDKSYNCISTYEMQKAFFREILIACSKVGGKIISIHSRFAIKDALQLIEKYSTDNIIILHWFTGTLKEIEKAQALGCLFSVNIAMLSNAKNDIKIRRMGIDSILPESDAPFITYKKKHVMPWETEPLIARLSDTFSLPPKQIERNFQELCRMVMKRMQI